MAEIKIDTSNMPGNSKFSDTKVEPLDRNRPREEKISQGKIRKKPFRKFFEAIFEGVSDPQSLQEYVIYDVIIPRLKDLVYDVGSSALHSIVYHDGIGGGYIPARNSTRVVNPEKYSNISKRSKRKTVTNDFYDFSDVVFDSRDEASYVLNRMLYLIDEYGDVPVASFYEASGIDPDFTDFTYGWKNLRNKPVTIKPARGGGFYINMPMPEYLE